MGGGGGYYKHLGKVGRGEEVATPPSPSKWPSMKPTSSLLLCLQNPEGVACCDLWPASELAQPTEEGDSLSAPPTSPYRALALWAQMRTVSRQDREVQKQGRVTRATRL